MGKKMSEQWQPANPAKLAKQFSYLGWTGFWIQFVLIAVPILLLIYVLFFASADSAQRRGIDLSNYLSYGGLIVMVFTALWSYRYTRLARRIADPDRRPPLLSVERTLWIGLWASFLGIVFSMLLLLSAAARLMFVLMTMPQTGLPVAALSGGDPSRTLSAIDAVSLTSLLMMLTAEFIVLAFTLWLLFRVTRPALVMDEDTIAD
jgi:hypothetical protein